MAPPSSDERGRNPRRWRRVYLWLGVVVVKVVVGAVVGVVGFVQQFNGQRPAQRLRDEGMLRKERRDVSGRSGGTGLEGGGGTKVKHCVHDPPPLRRYNFNHYKIKCMHAFYFEIQSTVIMHFFFIFLLLHLQQFLGRGPLLWILGQRQFDKVVEVVCPVAQKKGKRQHVRLSGQTTQK